MDFSANEECKNAPKPLEELIQLYLMIGSWVEAPESQDYYFCYAIAVMTLVGPFSFMDTFAQIVNVWKNSFNGVI